MRSLLRILAALAFLVGLEWGQSSAAVSVDSCSPRSASVSPRIDGTHTVGAGLTNGILTVIIVVGTNNTITPVSAVWDLTGTNQAMTAVPGSPAVNGNQSIYAYYLLNPTSGNKDLTFAWTGGGIVGLQICSWQGASGVANFNSANGGTPQQVTVTAGSNDMVHGGFSSTSNFTSTGATQIDIDNGEPQWAIAWQRASGPNPTLQGNPGNAISLSAGFTITAAGGGGPTCNGGLLLMGAGGC